MQGNETDKNTHIAVRDMALLAEHLPSTHEDLRVMPSTAHKFGVAGTLPVTPKLERWRKEGQFKAIFFSFLVT